MSDAPAGPWHRAAITIDTFIAADGVERPGYSFGEPECPPECAERGCLLKDYYWPPEFSEVPGVGAFQVRYRMSNWPDSALEWQEA